MHGTGEYSAKRNRSEEGRQILGVFTYVVDYRETKLSVRQNQTGKFP